MFRPVESDPRPVRRTAVAAWPDPALRWATTLQLSGQRWLRRRLTRGRHDERGDVNGYVFVTLMTAGIVMVIWVVARDRLTTLFERAISSVTGP